jgi:hypothetical protein
MGLAMTDTSHIPPETKSTPELISSAFQNINGLIRGEIALARAETADSLRAGMAGVGLMAGALVMVITALNVFAAAIVAGLAEMGIHPGWAAFATGIAFLLAAFILAKAGKAALDPARLTPNRTAENIRRDAETLKEAYK